MRYRVKFSDQAEKKLMRFSCEIATRIRDKVKLLERVTNPRKYLRKVEGLPGEVAYRFRVGDYRLFLTFKDDELIILVIDIGPRKNVNS